MSSLQEIIRIASELQATQTRAAELEQQLVRAAKAFGDKAPPAPPPRAPKPEPAPRGERLKQVADLAATGLEATQIASKLGISRGAAIAALFRARQKGLVNGAAVGAPPSPGGGPPTTG